MVVEVATQVPYPTPIVFEQLDSVQHWRQWAIWATSQENDEVIDGQKWHWEGYLDEDIHGYLSIDEVDENRGIAGRLYFHSQDTADFQIILEPIGNTTQITWKYVQYIGINPILQVKSLVAEKIVEQILQLNLDAINGTLKENEQI